jgi:CBS domain containing-hemolysin-like protein
LGTSPFSAILILIFIVLFSGFEFALYSCYNINIEPGNKWQSFGIKIFSRLLKNSVQYISTMLLGSIVSIVIFCYLIANISESLTISTQTSIIGTIFFQTIIAAFILITFGIFFPMTFFRIKTNLVLNFIAIPVAIVYFILYPITMIIFKLSWHISKIMVKPIAQDKMKIIFFGRPFSTYSNVKDDDKKELELDIEHDVKIFQNALDFTKVKLRECAIPRNEIEAIEYNSPIEKLVEKFVETGFSKILIYQETIDNIIGFAQSVDMFQSPKNISSIIKYVIIVPETMPANKLLNVFLKEHKSMAVVVDEFGGTHGIVTIEDIMEEIFGEIEDEHDSTDLREEKISDTEFILSGRLEIDYLNEKYNFAIPKSDDYATIAGFILDYNEKIPKENDKIKIFKFEFEILKLRNPKIELVKLKLLKKA